MVKLQSHIRHCLYISWALPVDALPTLPEPLRYQTCDHEGESFAFASALFFRHDEARFASLPLLRMSFPQLNLRLCVLADDDVPAVFFQRLFVPGWVLLPIRLLTRQPATRARFRYPDPSSLGPWEWSVRSDAAARCRAELASPELSDGPSLGNWEATVAFLRHRNRGYVVSGGDLQVLRTEQPTVEVVPVHAELLEDELLVRVFPEVDWPPPHCAFLCPEIPLLLELGTDRASPLALEAPAAG